MIINNFNELIHYFSRPEVEYKHIQEICCKAMCIIFVDEHPKERAIQLLIDFWDKWQHTKEKPIFIDVD
jgi:hypothetical protein